MTLLLVGYACGVVAASACLYSHFSSEGGEVTANATKSIGLGLVWIVPVTKAAIELGCDIWQRVKN